jgi:hypothetical protein
MEPTPEKIAEIKAKYPDRALELIEAKDGEDEIAHFVLTGPLREEYKKFSDEMLAAKDAKQESDKLASIRGAIERAALAQIRWPDRETVQALFNARPAMVDGFAEVLHKAAGSNVELRAKKL